MGIAVTSLVFYLGIVAVRRCIADWDELAHQLSMWVFGGTVYG